MDNDKECELRKHRCCFTGHRPWKLHCSENTVKKKLKSAIRQAIRDGYVTFIIGMCYGIDLWAGEIVIAEKKKNSALHLVAAIPHPDFEKSWEEKEQQLYYKVLSEVDIAKTISEHYYRSCYQKRNTWLVDRSSRVIAAYNGESGGTKNTIIYAEKHGIEVINILDK